MGKIIAVFLILSILIIPLNYTLSNITKYQKNEYIPHNPIYIKGNGDFTTENGVVEGSGTMENPYIIKKWDINTSSSNGIAILDTDKYFIIKECYIHDGNGSQFHGIILWNASNGGIYDTILEKTGGEAINIMSSPAITISNCSISDNWGGIHPSDSLDILIQNCNISYNTGISLVLSNCSNNKIKNCSFYSNILGPKVIDTTDTIMENCRSNNNHLDGFGIEDSSYISIQNCSASANNYGGIDITRSYFTKIENCSSHKNNNGIVLLNSSYNVITNCISRENGRDGIMIYGASHYNSITKCTSYNNGLNGFSIFYNPTHNNISECLSYNNDFGFHIESSSNYNNLMCCTSRYNERDGIYISWSSSYNTILNCSSHNNNGNGIQVYMGTKNNTITRCTIHNNSKEQLLLWWNSTNNMIYDNNFWGNENYCVSVTANSNNNVFYNNTFIGKIFRVALDTCENQWDNGEKGNYWSDYRIKNPFAVPFNGIWNRPYPVAGGENKDRYPLFKPHGESFYFIRPSRGDLYIFGRRIMPTLSDNVIIIGRIILKTYAVHEKNIDKVEFYLDDRLIETVNETPFAIMLDETAFWKHTILAKAYYTDGSTPIDQMDVVIFNI